MPMFEFELEYKYRADEVKFSEFKKLMDSLPVVEFKNPASWDVYYVQPENQDSFQRLRKSDEGWELTKKVKVKDANNWKRFESDLPLSAKATEKMVAFHVSLDGYRENFRIYKVCSIYFLNEINYVYYAVFDENLKEVGRFIEVEVNKSWLSSNNDRTEAEALKVLRDGELRLEQLGITAQNRLKKSLFELYRKVG